MENNKLTNLETAIVGMSQDKRLESMDAFVVTERIANNIIPISSFVNEEVRRISDDIRQLDKKLTFLRTMKDRILRDAAAKTVLKRAGDSQDSQSSTDEPQAI